MLNKITLLIPTHNRHSHLERTLNYYKKSDIKIIVVDSTKIPFALKNKFKIDYYHYPECYYSEKLCKTIQKVKTPYVLMCPDDDFIIASTISKCINFLEEHKDYSSAQGHWFRFRVIKGITSFWPSLSYLLKLKFDVNGETPEKRMKQLMTIYVPLIYCVHRTENLTNAFRIIKKFNGQLNFNLLEHLIGLVSVINGKHKILPILYFVREKHIERWNIKEKLFEQLDTIVNNPKLQTHYEFFINSLSEYLSDRYNYGVEDSNKYILGAIDSYLKFYRLNEVNFSLREKKLIRNLNDKRKILSIIINNRLPELYDKISNKKLYQRLENPSLKKYKYSEIIKIREYIIKYPIKT